ncbi:MAG: cytochrome c3 family protein [Caldilineaceae bacterium]
MRKSVFLASFAVALLLLLITGQVVFAQDTSSEITATASVTENVEIPNLVDWQSSAHADFASEPFRHWDNAEKKEVPAGCAKCHSTPGYQDFLGADGSEAGVVDKAAPLGSVISCVACHNDKTLKKDSVVMPSGLEIKGLGDESRCMECHQGRESTVSVNEAISKTGVTDEDAVVEDLGFRNIHYYAAAATKYGTLAKGGYEYDGQKYDAKFAHVKGFETCIDCHNSHTLKVNIEGCKNCHEDVKEVDDLKNVRMASSEVDYDGDGDVKEGIYYELQGLQELLMQTMQSYATNVAGTAVVYSPDAYPYFFVDTNANGTLDEGEGVADNAFKSWTPRLVKAAYNYQTSIKDPGAFAHGGKYIIELLYDSMADLNGKLAEPADMANLHRTDSGHFAGSNEAFRHWDSEEAVPGTCAKCHTPTGLPMFLKEGTTISQPQANGLECTTCHSSLPDFKQRYEVKDVKFPSGAVIDSGDPNTNLCMNCHQGRESTVSVNKLIGDADADTVSDKLRFLNPHYFAAGATRFGTEAKGAYEYEGKEYIGFFDHEEKANNCTDCHNAHSLEVKWDTCTECHEEVQSKEDLRSIRYNLDDWNGNGDTEEGVYDEIMGMRDELIKAMQAYSAEKADAVVVYNSASYPYFFIDQNDNGEADADEINNDNRFVAWTPRLLRAAYNYQYSGKDPGAFTHNAKYIIQTLYDSIEDVGGDVSAMTRPE